MSSYGALIAEQHANDLNEFRKYISSRGKLTKHAVVRAQQRGIPHEVIDLILNYADEDKDVGSGCYSVWLSRPRLADRALRSQLGSSLDRAAGIILVIAGDTGEVVTTLHDDGGKRGRRYRRSH
jgi:hypothetical protein